MRPFVHYIRWRLIIRPEYFLSRCCASNLLHDLWWSTMFALMELYLLCPRRGGKERKLKMRGELIQWTVSYGIPRDLRKLGMLRQLSRAQRRKLVMVTFQVYAQGTTISPLLPTIALGIFFLLTRPYTSYRSNTLVSRRNPRLAFIYIRGIHMTHLT